MRIDTLSIQTIVCLFYDFPCFIHAPIGKHSIVLDRIFQPITSQGWHQKAIYCISQSHLKTTDDSEHLLKCLFVYLVVTRKNTIFVALIPGSLWFVKLSGLVFYTICLQIYIVFCDYGSATAYNYRNLTVKS